MVFQGYMKLNNMISFLSAGHPTASLPGVFGYSWLTSRWCPGAGAGAGAGGHFHLLLPGLLRGDAQLQHAGGGGGELHRLGEGPPAQDLAGLHLGPPDHNRSSKGLN